MCGYLFMVLGSQSLLVFSLLAAVSMVLLNGTQFYFLGFFECRWKFALFYMFYFWYSIYFFLLHSTCTMKSLLDLIIDDWIQFFPPTYCDKSKWFIHLWTMNMNKKNSRMKSRRYQHGEKNELWTKCEAIDSIT